MSEMLDHCNNCGMFFDPPLIVDDPNVLVGCDRACINALLREFPDNDVLNAQIMDKSK